MWVATARAAFDFSPSFFVFPFPFFSILVFFFSRVRALLGGLVLFKFFVFLAGFFPRAHSSVTPREGHRPQNTYHLRYPSRAHFKDSTVLRGMIKD